MPYQYPPERQALQTFAHRLNLHLTILLIILLPLNRHALLPTFHPLPTVLLRQRPLLHSHQHAPHILRRHLLVDGRDARDPAHARYGRHEREAQHGERAHGDELREMPATTPSACGPKVQ